ncbi:hypothetical protein EX895_001551 [Sporisorium graminicola]|uniref:Uncharacterized protein n=1 Tax=Sporisorium graminicola TaxID=280036 RepID=A0A4U7KZE2_9BASI|nr:hypothetical protein EX895_001551 [Sporisorium graminicola]TKY89766.1 hypothetical protein EX895_001551 [Sporisorium graminicola]
MSGTFDPFEYASQVYSKADVRSPLKQLLFEVGLCEILVVLVVDVAADEGHVCTRCIALAAIRMADQEGTPQSKVLVETAHQAVDAFNPDDEDARAWCWTSALW